MSSCLYQLYLIGLMMILGLVVRGVANRSGSRSRLIVRQFIPSSSILRSKPTIIDAEIVGESDPRPEGDKNNKNKNQGMKRRDNKKESGGLFSGIVNMSKKMIFGEEDEKTKRKREQKAELSKGIDSIFKGTGLAGGILGSMAKGVAGMALDAMSEATAGVDEVQQKVASALEQDGTLGYDVHLGFPMSQSSSSLNINGIVSKSVQLLLPAEGSKGTGTVQVDAKIDDNGVVLNRLILQTSDGRTKSVSSAGDGIGGVIDVEGREI